MIDNGNGGQNNDKENISVESTLEKLEQPFQFQTPHRSESAARFEEINNQTIP